MGLTVLLDEAEAPALALPEELEELYGGPLALAEESLYANFVQTVDGVVAIPQVERSNALVAAGSESDRFLMGLLRAVADVVLIGSGTLAGSPNALWRPEGAFAAGAEGFVELRRRLGLPLHPLVAVVTGSGALDREHPLLRQGALVLTTERGAARLGGVAPTEVVPLGGDGEVDPRLAVEELRARGHRRILSEAGPHLFGSLLRQGLVDELFLTVSPLLAGRGGEPRLGLVEGEAFLPGTQLRLALRGVRRDETHLFLRYSLA